MALTLELTLTTLSGERTDDASRCRKQFTPIGRRVGDVVPAIQIDDQRVSRKHATVEKRHGHDLHP